MIWMILNQMNPDIYSLNVTYAGVSSKHLAPAPPHNRAFWRRGPRADLGHRHQGTGILIREQASSSGNRHRHRGKGIIIREQATSSGNRNRHQGTGIVIREQASSSGNRHRQQGTGIVIREQASSSGNKNSEENLIFWRRLNHNPPPPPTIWDWGDTDIHVGNSSQLCELLPLEPSLWFNSPPPSPFPVSKYSAWPGGRGGGVVESCLRPYFCRSLTLCIWPGSEPTKLLDHPKQKHRRGGGLRQINTCRKVPLHVNFFRCRHFALVSIWLYSLLVHGSTTSKT